MTTLFGVLGVSVLFAIAGVWIAWKKQSYAWNLMIAWFVLPFIGLGVLVHVLPLSNGRYVQVVPFHSWLFPGAVYGFYRVLLPDFAILL